MNNIIVVGANGAVGSAMINALRARFSDAVISALCRFDALDLAKRDQFSANNIRLFDVDYGCESGFADAAEVIASRAKIDLVIVATGILHTDSIQPERALKHLSADTLSEVFAANTIVPAIAAKHFLPHLSKQSKSVFAALSARVGSISDNRLGGWYSYRASKAALNMIIKTAAIEVARLNKHAVVVGLHPGTVDSALSKPFQRSVPENKLFTPTQSAEHLVNVITKLTPIQTGKCFAWDGSEIPP